MHYKDKWLQQRREMTENRFTCNKIWR